MLNDLFLIFIALIFLLLIVLFIRKCIHYRGTQADLLMEILSKLEEKGEEE